MGLVLLLSAGCNQTDSRLKPGTWRGVIRMQGMGLPFNFTIDSLEQGYQARIRNGEEQLLLDEIRTEQDSVVMTMHIFDAELRAKIDGDSMRGFFNKNYEKNYRLPFRAAAGQEFRFESADESPGVDFSGTYEVTFVNDQDTTQAVGIFQQIGSKVTGTFLTPLGDYRWLEGNVVSNKLMLSVLDGNHAFIFSAIKNADGTLTGDYYSGRAWHQTWTGKLNPEAQMPNPNSLTGLKDGYEKIEFSFPDEAGNILSSNDDRFKNKPVVIQILGTWCPNCMDETRFLSDWYRRNNALGVEVVGLAFEAKDEFTYASERVQKMKNKIGVDYPVLIAGNKDKKKAAEALPALRELVAFPTMIFIGKDGKVKKIHTGFSGPGTQKYYDQFVQEFNDTIRDLLSE